MATQSKMERIADAVESISDSVGGGAWGLLTTDPTTFDTVAANSLLVVGGIYRYSVDGFLYRYIQFKDAVAYVAGHVLAWANATGTAVTNDRAGGGNIGIQAAGIATRVHTQDYYGFMLVQGWHTSVLGDGSVGAGESVVLDTGVDGGADTMAAGEEDEVFGMALEADSGTPAVFNCIVNCL